MKSNRRNKILFIIAIIAILFLAMLIQPHKEDKAIIATASANEDKANPSPTESTSTRNHYFQNNHINYSLEEFQDSVNDSIPQESNPTNNFQVVTDFGFNCSTGEPKDAIQEAIYSLPDQRSEPVNIYLSGIFEPVSTITH